MNNPIYSCRDEEIRLELTSDEVIRLIEGVYHQKYNPNLPNFDAWDQLLACESVAESTPVREGYYEEKEGKNESTSVKWNGNDSRKQKVNFVLTESKLHAIAKLKTCNYRTPPREIATLLEALFFEWKSNEGHWLYIAQHYTPKTINSVINLIVKLHTSSRISFQIPPAYFTKVIIKYRRLRKSFRKKEK